MSSLADTIESMLKGNVVTVVFSRGPKGMYIQVEQTVETGKLGGLSSIKHQAEGGTVAELLEEMKRQVEHADVMNVVQEPGRVIVPRKALVK